ncbi:CHASE2 domain-containing serine/threonine-protein kinase [Candidatus Symbiobacter mobilis]|uniref:non-specific serine/threonine protein kinase n=1 Tax=Candidatus Symbiobacter mobilis CR TaxID=946483 RepID=U5ND19_9BURK|nr:serine/threonine-protein kinase [Candidatus Symbiobacter mobilis]AGX88064.1 serine/threonine protein kinase [Candidatus Symbiobacter mobilis CR]
MKLGKSTRLWRTDGFVAVVAIVAMLVLHLSTDAIGTIERRFYDYASTSTARQPSGQIAVIAIDDQSIANIGRWPWSRDVLARMIDTLAQAKAKTIVLTTFFFEPQVDRGLRYIQTMKGILAAQPPAEDGTLPNQPLLDLIREAETALDTDAQLAQSLAQAGNVLLPSLFDLGEPRGNPDTELPAFAQRSAIEEFEGFSIPAVRAQEPLAALGEAAAGVGHLNQLQDMDGALRREVLLVNYYGKAIPSMALLAALHSLNLKVSDVKLHPGEAVQIGKLRITTDGAAMMLPQFYPMQAGRGAFPVDSFFDVLNGKIPASKYAGKIVVIGATAAGVGTQFAAPGSPALSPAETIAHVGSSILQEHFIVQPGWAVGTTWLIGLLVCAYLVALLPKMSAGMSAGVTSVLFAGMLGSEFVLLSASALWLDLVFPAALLLWGHLALTTKRFLVTEAGKLKSDEESAETNRMMGLALQGQGQLDMAFDRFRRVPVSEELMGNLYNLALDFERKRQFNKAQAVYEHMAGFDAGYKDLQTKLNRAKNLSETVMLGGGGSHPGGALLLDGGAVEKPMLGRYQVEKELGKGAMGIVYLGRDPKIGRVVAIKTMALGDEFEGSELVDARERFFREAETAGRLQHQNIVTIFDAGEEHDLAYIAMEFLKGKDLTGYCKPDNLLPVSTVVSIVSRVAQALAYAHRAHVVHRDIKPANIMYELDSDTVKVTDFGIARITDSSKTKTGLVLGTPSFMSPEQLSGKKVDGRSDLYSLGVMLYQMLTAVLPFRGESMSELMYKIANEEASDVRTIRPELSAELAAVVACSMRKDPNTRYQDGDAFAQALQAAMGAPGTTTPSSPSTPAAPPTPPAPPPPQSAHPTPAGSNEKTSAFTAPGQHDTQPDFANTSTMQASTPDAAKGVQPDFEL